MMYTNLALALALFGVGAHAQGYTCPAGQTFFAASGSSTNRCCPTTLLDGCTLSQDATLITCQWGPGTAVSWQPGVTVDGLLTVAGAPGQSITGDAANPPKAGGAGGRVSASISLVASSSYQIRVGREGGEATGVNNGVRWGAGGGYSAFISSGALAKNQWTVAGAGGGGAGRSADGQSAAGDNLKDCKVELGPGVAGANNRGGGGAGCPGGAAGNAGGAGGKAGTSARGPASVGDNYQFAPSQAASISLTFPCEEVVFVSTVVSATVTETKTQTVSTVYTAPPTSTVTENETPPVSTIKETTTATQTYPTSIVVETSTPPVVTVDETKTETAFSTVQTATTVTPDTVQSTFSTDTTITPATRTATSTITSSTGVANCVQIRMVYNPNCCPASYVAMSSRLRHRRRGLHGGGLGKRILTGTLTDGRSTSSTTEDATETLEGETPVSTLTETAATPLFTESYTDTSTLETPLTTTTTTLEAARETKTALETTTIVDATNVETIRAATPTNTISSTSTHFAPTPVTTTTTTAFARSTSCAIQLGATQNTCPLPFLAGADHVVQIALLKAKKLLTGRPVIVDCGSAGQYLY